jgi:hypothetical protein
VLFHSPDIIPFAVILFSVLLGFGHAMMLINPQGQGYESIAAAAYTIFLSSVFGGFEADEFADAFSPTFARTLMLVLLLIVLLVMMVSL